MRLDVDAAYWLRALTALLLALTLDLHISSIHLL